MTMKQTAAVTPGEPELVDDVLVSNEEDEDITIGDEDDEEDEIIIVKDSGHSTKGYGKNGMHVSPMNTPTSSSTASSRPRSERSTISNSSKSPSSSRHSLLPPPPDSPDSMLPSPPMRNLNSTPKVVSSAKSKSPSDSKASNRTAQRPPQQPKSQQPQRVSSMLSQTSASSSNSLSLTPQQRPKLQQPQRIPSMHSQASGSSSSTRVHDNSTACTPPGNRSSAGPNGSRRRSRRLQWIKSVRVNVIPNLGNFSQQEKLQTWYTADEYSLMEDECDLTSECLDAKKPLWPGFCGRGLESWTMAGEQRKEQHVQLAIDIVWQAQLDQWRQSSNTDECWEFIRSQYLQISKPCLRLANEIALNDEKDIAPYLASVKALEKSRRKMLGIRSKTSSSHGRRVIRRKVSRTVSDNNLSPDKVVGGRSSPRRTLSDAPATPVLRPAIKYPDDDFSAAADLEKTPKAGSGGKSRKIHHSSKSSVDTNTITESEGATTDTDDNDDSTLASSIVEAYSKKKNLANKKIEFRPKSKTKVPTSPVGSLAASMDTADTSSTMRRMRSHLSVASDDSTRRRMMRTAALKNPL